MITIETATHVAGAQIALNGRMIQRCSVCGEKLADSADKNLSRFWAEGELVLARDGFLKSANAEFLSLQKVPRDFCIGLVE